jgi:hypothetical protein
MFTDVDADRYVLVDSDATYDAPSMRAMIDMLARDQFDMVCAVRADREQAAYRLGHRLGHRVGDRLQSGYRMFTRRFVKSFPVLSGGFEIETGLTIHALEPETPVGELRTPYYSRPQGSSSELSTWCYGYRIRRTILRVYRADRPLPLLTGIGASPAIVSIGFAIPVFVTYFREGTVPRLPTTVLWTGLMLLAFLSIACSLILDTVTRGRRELKLLADLAQRAPAEERWRR